MTHALLPRPQTGDRQVNLSSTVGTNVNIIRPENELSFEYISALGECRIRCTYTMLVEGSRHLVY